MLNPVWLRTLRVVVEARSFADAARQLGYTPSAVSQQMGRLERHLDMPLFKRDKRGIIPTDAAIRLTERATPLLDMLTELERMDDVHGNAIQVLRLGICCGGTPYLRPALRQLAQDGTAVSVSTAAGESAHLVADIESGTLDAAVVCRYDLVPRTWPAQVSSRLLADEPLAVLAPVGHPLAARSSTALGELRHESWITGPESADATVCLSRACAATGFRPRVMALAHDLATVAELVAAGLGVALVPCDPAWADTVGVVTVPLTGLMSRRVEVVKSAANGSSLLTGFIARLRYPALDRQTISPFERVALTRAALTDGATR